jgi:2'-5' RNA ligase
LAAPDAPKRRLFVGTFLSPAAQASLLELAEQEQKLARAWGTKVRFVDSRMLHLTWLFLGQVEARLVDEITARLTAVAGRHQPFELTYDQLEYWPSRRLARYLVVVPPCVVPAATALAADLKDTLREFVQRPEDRPYRPHLTIMRFSAGLKAEQGSIALFSMQDKLPIAQSVQKIELLESRLQTGKDQYTALQSFQLNIP